MLRNYSCNKNQNKDKDLLISFLYLNDTKIQKQNINKIVSYLTEVRQFKESIQQNNLIIQKHEEKLNNDIWLNTRLSLLNEEKKLKEEVKTLKQYNQKLLNKIKYRQNKINSIIKYLSLEEKLDILINLFILIE